MWILLCTQWQGRGGSWAEGIGGKDVQRVAWERLTVFREQGWTGGAWGRELCCSKFRRVEEAGIVRMEKKNHRIDIMKESQESTYFASSHLRTYKMDNRTSSVLNQGPIQPSFLKMKPLKGFPWKKQQQLLLHSRILSTHQTAYTMSTGGHVGTVSVGPFR